MARPRGAATTSCSTLLVSLGMCFAQFPALWGILYLLIILLAVFGTCKLALWGAKRSLGNKPK
jgi:hypothetical protein